MTRQGGLLIRSFKIIHSYRHRIKIIAYVFTSLQIQDTLYLFLLFFFYMLPRIVHPSEGFYSRKDWNMTFYLDTQQRHCFGPLKFFYSLEKSTPSILRYTHSWHKPCFQASMFDEAIFMIKRLQFFFSPFPPSANESDENFHDLDDQRYFPRKRTNIRWYSVRKMNREERSWGMIRAIYRPKERMTIDENVSLEGKVGKT